MEFYNFYISQEPIPHIGLLDFLQILEVQSIDHILQLNQSLPQQYLYPVFQLHFHFEWKQKQSLSLDKSFHSQLLAQLWNYAVKPARWNWKAGKKGGKITTLTMATKVDKNIDEDVLIAILQAQLQVDMPLTLI